MKYTFDDIDIDVIIERKKIKNIYFRIKEDLKLYVSCGYLCSDKYIKKLLNDNKNSIIRMYNNMQSKVNIKNDIYYLGSKMNYIYDDKIYIDGLNIYGPSVENINNYLEKNSLSIFKNRLDRLMIQFDDLPKFRLRIRHMKTRWGVCNKSSMTVTLNTELIHKDVSLIDYVIVHELCHFKYMDHSKNFWMEVEKYYPYYKLARKRLK